MTSGVPTRGAATPLSLSGARRCGRVCALPGTPGSRCSGGRGLAGQGGVSRRGRSLAGGGASRRAGLPAWAPGLPVPSAEHVAAEPSLSFPLGLPSLASRTSAIPVRTRSLYSHGASFLLTPESAGSRSAQQGPVSELFSRWAHLWERGSHATCQLPPGPCQLRPCRGHGTVAEFPFPFGSLCI